jgi:hypothetical protein
LHKPPPPPPPPNCRLAASEQLHTDSFNIKCTHTVLLTVWYSIQHLWCGGGEILSKNIIKYVFDW